MRHLGQVSERASKAVIKKSFCICNLVKCWIFHLTGWQGSLRTDKLIFLCRNKLLSQLFLLREHEPKNPSMSFWSRLTLFQWEQPWSTEQVLTVGVWAWIQWGCEGEGIIRESTSVIIILSIYYWARILWSLRRYVNQSAETRGSQKMGGCGSVSEGSAKIRCIQRHILQERDSPDYKENTLACLPSMHTRTMRQESVKPPSRKVLRRN